MSHATTVSDSNATAMREFHPAIFDDHDLDAIETYLSPDVVCYQAGTELASGYDGGRDYFGSILRHSRTSSSTPSNSSPMTSA